VNGLPKLVKGIHYIDLTKGLPTYKCEPCDSILKSGKRKGLQCGSKCMLGFSMCKRHHTAKLKKEDKDKDKDNPSTNQLGAQWHDTLANYQNSSLTA